MSPYKAFYGRRYRSSIGWFKIGEAELIKPDLIHQAMEKVKIFQERLKTAHSRQKSYTDIIRRVGNAAYELELLPLLDVVHLVLHISMLKTCLGDPSIIVPTENIRVKDSFSYEEIFGQILDRQENEPREITDATISAISAPAGISRQSGNYPARAGIIPPGQDLAR
ncbi:uncharacterized protein LOC129883674 [Solanum dulcamara]|uniref:uncharacterized protein LOC129883674 n=1 Tax=Solanum dulcamara TaxID=45834 RepID=UPI002485BF92|nr:uncharacterized protein LOC129883674 [Solanum dulcamara]